MESPCELAPGAPGIAARWTTSAKDGVGTAINAASALSFTLSHGILNEVYYPREDRAAIRDLGLIVTNGRDFFSEEKRDTRSVTRQTEPGVPSFVLDNTCREGRYRITKQIVADPYRNTVLQRVTFRADRPDDYRVYALLAPHLANAGGGNSAWCGDYKGHALLFATHEGVSLAFACSIPWLRRSVGYVGVSDGWQELRRDFRLDALYGRAQDGNVALTGEVDLARAEGGAFELAVGFATTPLEAAHHALSTLLAGFGEVSAAYAGEWRAWQDALLPVHETEHEPGGMFRVSAQVLRVHQSKTFPGAMVASLSIPWGNTKGDSERSGYHLVWPRDLVESAGGLLALRSHADVLRILNYLSVTQEADGHWSQNMGMDGTPYLPGLQLDQAGLPILLVDLCRGEGILPAEELRRYWPTVRRAAVFLLRHGIVTGQERWEEQRGVSVSTMATLVPALLAAAGLGDVAGEPALAAYLRETADAWNESIDRWLYAAGAPLARRLGVDGYYLRVNPTATPAAALGATTMQVKNQPPGRDVMPVTELVSTDPLALVRFGLRAADDPRILATVRVIDELLTAETPNGTAYYRYVNDGYGEHDDGSAFDGTGRGRPWPLLAAERAHYELAAGHPDRARELLRGVERFSNYGLLSEQIWDQADIPWRGLVHGEHSGSAMPLVWAHAEHIKLVCSLKLGRVFDLPREAYRRYVVEGTGARHVIWRIDLPVDAIPADRTLRVETVAPATVRWTSDGWATHGDAETSDIGASDAGAGVSYADLHGGDLPGRTLEFAIRWRASGAWTGRNYRVVVGPEA